MSERGFTYHPEPFIVQSPTDRWRSPAAALRDQYLGALEENGTSEDQNADHLATLSEQERASWERALHGGVGITSEMSAADVGQALLDQEDKTSCGTVATEQARASSDTNFELLDEYSQRRAAIADDQRVVEATVAWSRCLAMQGFQFERPNEVRDHQEELLYAALSSASSDSNTLELLDSLADAEEELNQLHNLCYASVDSAMAEVEAEIQSEFLQQHG